jgi:uncharacterized alkaline shock family protein YloU
MMNTEESRTDLGSIRIHKNVIASIASLAATEIEGVKRVGASFNSRFLEMVTKISFLRIKVNIDKNEQVSIEIPLIIMYGFNIPQVASRVQENVKNALEKMTNVSIREITVNVQGIERR